MPSARTVKSRAALRSDRVSEKHFPAGKRHDINNLSPGFNAEGNAAWLI